MSEGSTEYHQNGIADREIPITSREDREAPSEDVGLFM